MADTKFKVGDHIIYAGNGVCYIEDIRNERFGGAPKTYYVMHAIHDPRSVIYVPTDAERLTAEMWALLSRYDIERLIEESDISNEVWITDNKARAAHYTEMLSTGDRSRLLVVIRMLTAYKTELEAKKKKFYVTDERVLTAASKLITEEFSFVLGIEQNEVIPYILERVK